MKKSLRSCFAALSVAAVLATAAPAAAIAAESAPATAAAAAESSFQGFVQAAEISASAEAQIMENFSQLSIAEQQRIAADPMSAVVIGPAETSTTREAASSPGRVSVNAVEYNVTSNATSPTHMLGVKIGEFRMTFRYVTGSNIVKRTTACDSWFSGFAGFWNMSVQSIDHYTIANGQAQCIARHHGSLVYKGSAINMNKQMGMTVNGPGIVNWWLNNI